MKTLCCFNTVPSNINCVLLDLKDTGWTAADFWSEMQARKLLCRDIGHQGLNDETRYVRLAVLNEDNNEKMVTMISAVILSKHDVATA